MMQFNLECNRVVITHARVCRTAAGYSDNELFEPVGDITRWKQHAR